MCFKKLVDLHGEMGEKGLYFEGTTCGKDTRPFGNTGNL